MNGGHSLGWPCTHARTHAQPRLNVEVCALGEGHDTLQEDGAKTAPPRSLLLNKAALPRTPLSPPLTECRMPGDASTMPLLAQLQLAPSIHRPYTMQPSSGATSSSRGLPATYADANSSVLIATLYLRA